MATRQFFSQRLSTVGDGSGTTEATGDYSVTQAFFKIMPPQDTVLKVDRMNVVIRDTAATAEKYGNIASGLTTGIYVDQRSGDSIEEDLLGGNPIKTNIDWADFAGVDVELKEWGAGDAFVVVRWTFEKAEPLVLDGQNKDRLVVTVNDDLTGLVSHRYTVQGHRFTGNARLPNILASAPTEPDPTA